MNANDLWQASAWLGSGTLVQLTWALVHFLWQGCAIAIIYAVVARALRRAPANVRYVGGVAALLAMIACLPATLRLLPPPVELPTPTASVDTTPLVATTDVSTMPDASYSVEEPSDADVVKYAPPSIVASEPPPEPIPAQSVGAVLLKTSPYVGPLYLAGVIAMLLRVAVGLWSGRRLRRDCEPIADSALAEVLRRNARRMGLRIVPAMAYCQRICVPVVVGVFRPMILLPASLASGLTLSQLETVLLHELAHVRRFDLAVNVFQRLVEALLFFHPAVWWVSRRVSLERENACDDAVLHLDHERVQYADALLRVAELCTNGRIDRAALAATGGNASQFRRRVLRLLGAAEKTPLRLTTSGVLMSVLLMASLLVVPVLWRNSANAESDTPAAAASSDAEKEGLSIREYRLRYVRALDVKKLLKPLLGPSGKLVIDSNAKSEILFASDEERTLKTIDSVVAALDVQPTQVLVHAVLLRIKPDSSVAAKNDTTRTPASRPVAQGIDWIGSDMQGLRFGWIDKEPAALVKALESKGEARVIAEPTLVGLNKHLVRMELCIPSTRRPTGENRTGTTNAAAVDGKFSLAYRPFASSDGATRMEFVLDRASQPNTAADPLPDGPNIFIPKGQTLAVGFVPTTPLTNNTTAMELVFLMTPEIVEPQNAGESVMELKELGARVYKLEHARADIVKQMLTPLVSPRGKVIAVATLNDTIVAVDDEATLAAIDRVIKTADVPQPQVMIDTAIIEVQFKKGSGIEAVCSTLEDQRKTNTVTMPAFDPFIDPAKARTGSAKARKGIWLCSHPGGVKGTIDCFDKHGRTKVLAMPRLLVLDKQYAMIQLGDLPGLNNDADKSDTASRQLFLQMRPSVLNNNHVWMAIHLERGNRENTPRAKSKLYSADVEVCDTYTVFVGRLPDIAASSTANGEPKKELYFIYSTRVWRPTLPASGATSPGGGVQEQPSINPPPLTINAPPSGGFQPTPPKLPPSDASPATPAKERLITICADDLDVRKMIEMLSRDTKITIMVSPNVTGKITMNVENKSLDDILAAISKVCHLVVHREGDVIFISTAAEIRTAEEGNMPLRVYRLSYVKSNDLLKMIKPLLSKNGTITASLDSTPRLPSDDGGSSARDELLIVQDYEDVLKKVDNVIAQIDVRPSSAGDVRPSANPSLGEIASSIRGNYAALGGVEATVERVLGREALPPVPMGGNKRDQGTIWKDGKPVGVGIARPSKTPPDAPLKSKGHILMRSDALRCQWTDVDSDTIFGLYDNLYAMFEPRENTAWLSRSNNTGGLPLIDLRDIGGEQRSAEHFVDQIARSKLIESANVVGQDGHRLVRCLLETPEGRQHGLRYRCWFDPDKRLLPVTVEYIGPDGSAYQTFRISYQKVGDASFWFLLEARCTFALSGQSVGFRVTSLKTGLNLPDAVFKILLPAGADVHDNRSATPESSEKLPRPFGATAQRRLPPEKAFASERPRESKTPAANPPSPTNKPLLSIHADNLDVRRVIEKMSREAKMNIVVSPGVSGKITMDVRDMSCEDALALVAKQCSLVVRRDNGVIYISTQAEMRRAEEDNLPIRVYQLKYVKSGDVLKMVSPLKSRMGKIACGPDAGDSNTNIIIFQDYEDVLNKVDRVISLIDVRPPEVIIEAVLLQTEFGSGRAAIDNAASKSATDNTSKTTGTSTSSSSGGYRSIQFAFFGKNALAGFVGNDAAKLIKTLQSDGNAKILAQPKLVCLNKKVARMELADPTGGVKTAGAADRRLQFAFRPFVSSDGMIRTEIQYELKTAKPNGKELAASAVEPAWTNVLMPEGQTLAISFGPNAQNPGDDLQESGEFVLLVTPRIAKPQESDKR